MFLSVTRKHIFTLFFILWIGLAFFDVIFNTVKTFTEAKQWFFLTDEGKRSKIFGDLYLFFQFIQQNTHSSSNIIIYSPDVRTFYLGIYYLYPRVITTTNNKKQLMDLLNEKKFDYIAVYDEKMSVNSYKKIASFSSKTGNNYGALYHQK